MDAGNGLGVPSGIVRQDGGPSVRTRPAALTISPASLPAPVGPPLPAGVLLCEVVLVDPRPDCGYGAGRCDRQVILFEIG